MPTLLAVAYGATIAEQMRNTNLLNLKVEPSKKTPTTSSLGAAVPPAPSSTEAEVVAETHRPMLEEKQGNYEIHITIDRQDCHLLCLFLGVFTLSVLFNSSKRGNPSD